MTNKYESLSSYKSDDELNSAYDEYLQEKDNEYNDELKVGDSNIKRNILQVKGRLYDLKDNSNSQFIKVRDVFNTGYDNIDLDNTNRAKDYLDVNAKRLSFELGDTLVEAYSFRVDKIDETLDKSTYYKNGDKFDLELSDRYLSIKLFDKDNNAQGKLFAPYVYSNHGIGDIKCDLNRSNFDKVKNVMFNDLPEDTKRLYDFDKILDSAEKIVSQNVSNYDFYDKTAYEDGTFYNKLKDEAFLMNGEDEKFISDYLCYHAKIDSIENIGKLINAYTVEFGSDQDKKNVYFHQGDKIEITEITFGEDNRQVYVSQFDSQNNLISDALFGRAVESDELRSSFDAEKDSELLSLIKNKTGYDIWTKQDVDRVNQRILDDLSETYVRGSEFDDIINEFNGLDINKKMEKSAQKQNESVIKSPVKHDYQSSVDYTAMDDVDRVFD